MGGLQVAPARLTMTFTNTNTVSETVLVTFQRGSSGTKRRIARAVLATNEHLVITGLPIEAGDSVFANATDASQVDYLVTTQAEGYLDIYSLDVNGALKQVNSASTTSGASTITAASANALAVGPSGTTNPTFNVDSSTASAATGLNVKGAAAGSGLAVSVISSNTNDPLTIDAKGSGIITLGSVSTGGANVRAAVQTVAASGTAIGNAAAVVEGFTYVTASNNSAAVKLPAGSVGMSVTLVNTVQTATLQVFPQVNNAINNLANNAVYNIPNGGKRIFTYATAGVWYTDPQTIT